MSYLKQRQTTIFRQGGSPSSLLQERPDQYFILSFTPSKFPVTVILNKKLLLTSGKNRIDLRYLLGSLEIKSKVILSLGLKFPNCLMKSVGSSSSPSETSLRWSRSCSKAVSCASDKARTKSRCGERVKEKKGPPPFPLELELCPSQASRS